jgi:hypothetical protein
MSLKTIAAFVILAFGAPALAADRVELELVTEKGFSITGAQDWLRALQDVGAQVRIRGEDGDVEPSIKTRGSGDSQTHIVVGILTSRDALILPGARFSIRDKQRIADWVAALKADGASGVTEERGAFGLTGEQLLSVHEQLARPVTAATKGVRVKKALNSIVSGLTLKVVVDPEAFRDVAPEEVVLDELEGVAAGTALAAALRPYALAFAPRKPPGGEIEIHVTHAGSLEEAWPVGWPVEKSLQTVAPNLFKHLKRVEIEDTPLSDALEVVASRIETPLLFDHNGMARERIDPAAVNVSVPPERTYYKRLIDRMLSQARLNAEVRVDEADRAFLWIAPNRR